MTRVDLDFAARRAHPALRALVSRYTGYRQHGVTLPVHRGLPSEHVTLVVSLADPVRIIGMPGSGHGTSNSTGDWQAFASGLHAGPALIAQDEVQAGLHLDLNPLGVRTLLGVSAAELSGSVIDLAALPRPGLGSLAARLHEAPHWRRRFEIVDEVLLACVGHAREHPPPGEIGWAWQRMRGSAGSARVAELAAEVGWSRRHFSERFARELGLPPKQAARVVRFGRACELLRRGGPVGAGSGRGGAGSGPRLGEVAAVCGYVDQAHLTNEFNALAGCTPGTWIAEELPFLQDPVVGTPAESRS